MITSYQPCVVPDGRYSISDTCKLLNIHRHTLRRYTKAGFIEYGQRGENGRKFYLGSEIIRFWKAQL